MIKELSIHGFKRFEGLTLGFRPLTVLSGLNGSGKTSVIHALLLAKEAMSAVRGEALKLNGPYGMELGTAESVRNWNHTGNIEMSIRTDDGLDYLWRLGVSSEDALYLTVEERPRRAMFSFSGRARAFCYLCAERFGPRNVLGASPLPPDQLEVGTNGEGCAQLIAELGDRPIGYDERLHPYREETASPLLKYEVEHWLSEVSRQVEVRAEQYPGSPVTKLEFRSPGAEWVRAPNMGFGMSYSLPVILGGLIAARGGLLIVENPEAHLHPAGQSRMGVFLAWLAGKGIQVIVETHSDHVLNGMRRAIGEFEYLYHDAASVHFFDSQPDDGPIVSELEFTKTGGINHWPPGFFDQYQIDAATLGRIRRRS